MDITKEKYMLRICPSMSLVYDIIGDENKYANNPLVSIRKKQEGQIDLNDFNGRGFYRAMIVTDGEITINNPDNFIITKNTLNIGNCYIIMSVDNDISEDDKTTQTIQESGKKYVYSISYDAINGNEFAEIQISTLSNTATYLIGVGF